MGAVRRSNLITILLAATSIGCSENLAPARPAQVAIFGGDAQIAEVGTALNAALAIRVTDGQGFPQRDVPVTWEVVAGGGTITPSTAATALTGIAEADWLLGTGAGVQRVRVTVAGLGAAEFTARAEPGAPTLVEVLQDSVVTRSLGDTVRLNTTVKDRYGNTIPSVALTWTSSNQNVATVDASGLVRIVGRGRSSIRGQIGTATEVVNVHVIEIARVRLTPEDASFASLNQTIQLQAIAEDANRQPLPGGSVVWSSANPNVVTVDQAGRARASGQGNTTVSVSIDGKAASVPVEVKQVPVGIGISPSNGVIGLGRTLQLTATVIDAGGSPIPGFTVDYGISDGTIASVNASGLVTSLNRGSVQITASAGGKSARTDVQISTLLTALSAGGRHVCGAGAVTTTTIGIGLCWGDDGDGRLGSAGPTPVSSPRAVNATLAFSDVTAGDNHSCALGNGVARCWGAGTEGQLGNGAAVTSGALVTVSSSGYSQISAGNSHTCALTSGGGIQCWGSNRFGQLGLSVSPTTCGATPCAQAPVTISGSRTWSQVSAGGNHTCAVSSVGDVYCWGLNTWGQLGINSTTGSPVPQQVSAPAQFTGVSAATDHTCAVATDGRVYCWGRNNAGQLGNGNTSDSLVPVAVSGNFSFAQVSTGGEHTCARRSAGEVRCWGNNANGQLGTGNNTNTLVPATVAGGHAFLTIDAGRDFTCGLIGTIGNSIGYCWGSNSNGQLGNGTLQHQNTPSRVF